MAKSGKPTRKEFITMKKATTMYKKAIANNQATVKNLEGFCEDYLMRKIESQALIGNLDTDPIKVPYYLDVLDIEDYLNKYGYKIEIRDNGAYFYIRFDDETINKKTC